MADTETAGKRSVWPLAGLATAMVALALGTLAVLFQPMPKDTFPLAHGVTAVVYLLAVWLVLRWPSPRGALLVIILAAVAMRLIAVTAPHVLTDDAFRYVWDARVQSAGINPYLYVPADERLSQLRDEEIYPYINRKETYPTIYPPTAQMVFFLGARIVDGIRGMQILILVLDLVAIWAIVQWLAARGQGRERVVIYAWHPLPLWELSGMAHIDGAGVALVCLALLAGQRGYQALSGIAFAAAGLVKYHFVLLVPAIWRRWRLSLPIAGAVTVLALYGPYLDAGTKVIGSLFKHLDEEGYSDGFGFYLVGLPRHFGLPYPDSRVFAVIAAMILAMIGAFIAFRRRPDVIEPWHLIALTSAFFLLVSPHYPWYYVLIIPVLCAQIYMPLLWMTLIVSFRYLERPDGVLEPYSMFKVYSAMYAGFVVLALWEWARSRRTGA